MWLKNNNKSDKFCELLPFNFRAAASYHSRGMWPPLNSAPDIWGCPEFWEVLPLLLVFKSALILKSRRFQSVTLELLFENEKDMTKQKLE